MGRNAFRLSRRAWATVDRRCSECGAKLGRDNAYNSNTATCGKACARARKSNRQLEARQLARARRVRDVAPIATSSAREAKPDRALETALEIGCPECAARRGAPCMRPTGPSTWSKIGPHPGRVKASRKLRQHRARAPEVPVPAASAQPAAVVTHHWYRLGVEVEILDAPRKADCGRFVIRSQRERLEGGDYVFVLHRILANGDVADEPPPHASASWYRRNRRVLHGSEITRFGRVGNWPGGR